MLKYAVKSLLSRKWVTFLYIFAVVIALTLGMIVDNISKQINEGFYNADNKYDVIIGPTGSSTQLVMSTLFFSDDPLGAIDYSYVKELEDRGDLDIVIPFGMSDKYNSAKVIGTSQEFLDGYVLEKGAMFEDSFEVVVGYNVFKAYNLNIGSTLITSHGFAGAGHQHKDKPYKVVGILEETKTAYDNVIFTDISSVWEAHEHYEEDEHHENDIHEDEHHSTKAVTAILIRSGSLAKSSGLISEFNDEGTQAINPTQVMRKLINTIDLSKQIVFILSVIVFILSCIIISIMTMLMLNSINKDIEILRFLGFSWFEVTKFISYQAIVQFSIGCGISLILHSISLKLVNVIAATRGIVIDSTKIYWSEINLIIFMIIFGAVLLCIWPLFRYFKYNKGKTRSDFYA